MKEIQENIVAAMKAVEISLGQYSESGIKEERTVRILKEHQTGLGDCLKSHITALRELSSQTDWAVKEAKAMEESTQFLGEVGDVNRGPLPQLAELLVSLGKSTQIAGRISEQALRDILNKK